MYNNSYVPQVDYKLKKTSCDDKKCLLKFSDCDKKYPMYKLSSNEIKEFVNYAKLVESLEWEKILIHTGLNYEMLRQLTPPSNISRDINLYSMRMSQKTRIIGYRQNEFFNIVWFDKNHDTC